MSNHLNTIDKIGEDLSSDIQNKDVEHDLICNTGTRISAIKKEVDVLDQIIKDYETYTSNAFLLNKLKNLKKRISNNINGLYTDFNAYVDYNEKNI